jgi:hypothetical protein
MNIYCEWEYLRGWVLNVFSGATIVAMVREEMNGDIVLTMTNPFNMSLTFVEIEHIMDNWHNMPRN